MIAKTRLLRKNKACSFTKLHKRILLKFNPNKAKATLKKVKIKANSIKVKNLVINYHKKQKSNKINI